MMASQADKPSVSFEFFPPKTLEMEKALWDALCDLAPLEPAFVSVTYGAGGTTRERTHATVSRIVKETGLTVAAHLTCVDATREEIETVARGYWSEGVRHIVALRGDPPTGQTKYVPHTDGYAYAADLVAALRAVAPFELSVAAYPETHPEAVSSDLDIDNLKRKVDAGAVRAITQFFFDNDLFFRFRDRVVAAGVKIPLVPGIMPVGNFKNMMRFADTCGAGVPDLMAAAYEGLDDDPAARAEVGKRLASEQCLDLCSNGVNDFHFYTLNRSELTGAVCANLGVTGGGPEIDLK
ncbi:MAG: methylenetetrahydrofolate reductase [NAD(P)H] [Alphaproteobacteria bacterium]|nr:methylenetetrahydrofolate reductase [NAD(P)H] [Alphaproteobacteria bacterium]HCP01091.1 methylenetetrahydrofolate reductase [NAD(P)H] [Rhodospirillaceae bacterium]